MRLLEAVLLAEQAALVPLYGARHGFEWTNPVGKRLALPFLDRLSINCAEATLVYPARSLWKRVSLCDATLTLIGDEAMTFS